MKAPVRCSDSEDQKAYLQALRLVDEVGSQAYSNSKPNFGGGSYKRVTTSDGIEVGEVEGSQWVSVQGKGNFSTSPRLKEFLELRLEEGAREVVVDLDGCSAMDSTFMGTLAGVALTLAQREGCLSVVGLSERNRDSLVDLGLGELLQLEEEDGSSPWSSRLGEIRANLELWEGARSTAAVAEEVLEAHQRLCEASQSNNAKFGAVIEVLEKECSTKGTL